MITLLGSAALKRVWFALAVVCLVVGLSGAVGPARASGGCCGWSSCSLMTDTLCGGDDSCLAGYETCCSTCPY